MCEVQGDRCGRCRKEKELCGKEQQVFECYFGSCVIKRASPKIGVLKNESDAFRVWYLITIVRNQSGNRVALSQHSPFPDLGDDRRTGRNIHRILKISTHETIVALRGPAES